MALRKGPWSQAAGDQRGWGAPDRNGYVVGFWSQTAEATLQLSVDKDTSYASVSSFYKNEDDSDAGGGGDT